MEKTIDALISTIENDYPDFLAARSEMGYILEAPANVVHGDVDVDKYRSPVNVFLIPDAENYDEDSADGGEIVSQSIDVFILIKKEKKEILSKKIIRYGEEFRKMIRANDTLGNTIDYIHTERAQYIEGVEGSDLIKGIKLTVKVICED